MSILRYADTITSSFGWPSMINTIAIDNANGNAIYTFVFKCPNAQYPSLFFLKMSPNRAVIVHLSSTS